MAKEIIEVIYMKNEKWKEDNDDEKDGYSTVIDKYPFDRYRVNKSKTVVVNSINIDVFRELEVEANQKYISANK